MHDPAAVALAVELEEEDPLPLPELELAANALMAEGKVTPFVEKTYPLAETAEALRYFEQGHARGKIVIMIE